MSGNWRNNIVAVTGTIGSGKSTVTRLFQNAFLTDGYLLYVYEIPLLFEVGMNKAGFQSIVVVTVDEEVAVQRVVQYRGLTEEDVRLRIATQLPRREKEAGADYVLDNSGSEDDLRSAVRALFTNLTSSE